MKDWRDYLYLFTGLVLGLGIGLLIAWVLAPVQFVDTSPASLRVDFKDDYRYMIASAYNATGDLSRARARLATIGDPDALKALGEQAQRLMANNSPMPMVQMLADLSEALQTRDPITPTPALTALQDQGIEASATQQIGYTPTSTATVAALTGSPDPGTPVIPEEDTPIPSPIPTLAPLPRPTASPTPGPAFELAQQASLCEPSTPGLLQIYLSNAAGKPVAGVELVITWFGGEEHFFSGLKPEINLGYADYALSENVEYDLSFSTAGTRVTGLRAPVCTDPSGNTYPGSIRLDFKQP